MIGGIFVLIGTFGEVPEDSPESEFRIAHILRRQGGGGFSHAALRVLRNQALGIPVGRASGIRGHRPIEVFLARPERPGDGKVRAAFRKEGRPSLFLDIVKEVILCGRSKKWGNVHEFSQTGVQEALAHLHYYDIKEVEILVPPKGLPFDVTSDPMPLITQAMWVPEGTAVIVPQNREFLGFVADIHNGSYISVVHNPSRGIAVAVRHANG